MQGSTASSRLPLYNFGKLKVKSPERIPCSASLPPAFQRDGHSALQGWTGTAVMRTLSMTPDTVSLERR